MTEEQTEQEYIWESVVKETVGPSELNITLPRFPGVILIRAICNKDYRQQSFQPIFTHVCMDGHVIHVYWYKVE